jgi:hypothetical protein
MFLFQLFTLCINYFFNYINMNYIIESIFVGIYTCFIYLLFSPFIKNFYLLLLVCGFFKHFLGSSFGLWTWYCNNGEACLRVLSQDQYYEANTLYLIRESIYESIIFLITGTIISFIIPKNIYLFLIMGILLHIWGEKSGIHKSFCRNSCDKID